MLSEISRWCYLSRSSRPWSDVEIRRVDGEGLDAALLTARRPLLVYFEAEGCAACDLGRPLLEQASAACDGRLEVLRCDVWDAPSAVARLRLLSLPAVLLFVNGEEVMRLAGVPRRRRLAALVGAGLRAAEAFETAASRRSA
jgi:thioredoxin 1